MSMHKKPLTRLEEEGLRAHGLPIGTPSQLSDVFRHGVAWAAVQDREVQRLREALNHIIRTCQGSRTSTRRLRWIEQRAQFALDDKPYSDDAFDLPKDATSSNEKLRDKVKDLRSLLNRVRLNVSQLQGMPGLLGDIEAELAASTGQEVEK